MQQGVAKRGARQDERAQPLFGLSLQALDNHVDNFAQALYDRAKCLIYKDSPCVA